MNMKNTIHENFRYYNPEISQGVKDFIERVSRDKKEKSEERIEPISRKVIVRKKDETRITKVGARSQEIEEKILNENLHTFVQEVYLPRIKTEYEIRLGGHRMNFKEREKMASEAKKRFSWLKYRKIAFEELFQRINKTSEYFMYPTSELLSVKAMMDWEDVFEEVQGTTLRSRLENALRTLMWAYESGARGIGDLSSESIQMALADAIFLARSLRVIENLDIYKEFENEIYQNIIATAGESFGKMNEYRFIYVMRAHGNPVIHSTPFQDKVASYRFDVAWFADNDKGGINVVGYQTKTHQDASRGEYYIDENIKKAYDLLVSDKTLSSQEKASITKIVNDHTYRFHMD